MNMILQARRLRMARDGCWEIDLARPWPVWPDTIEVHYKGGASEVFGPEYSILPGGREYHSSWSSGLVTPAIKVYGGRG